MQGLATHSSVLAWETPWTEEPGGLWFMESQRVGHDCSDLAAAAASRGDLIWVKPPPWAFMLWLWAWLHLLVGILGVAWDGEEPPGSCGAVGGVPAGRQSLGSFCLLRSVSSWPSH